MRFKNKVVIIMGAGDGIGRKASEVFSREGAKVVRVDINKDAFSDLDNGSSSKDNDLKIIADGMDETQVKGVMAKTLEAFGGFDVLINSFINIQSRIKQNLFIFGEGEEKKNLYELIKKNKAEKRIKIFNFTNKPYSHLKGCTLFVLSSRWEGMPNTLIQALASRANILSTNCKFGPKQILKNGKLGYLCKVNDVDDMSKKIIIALKTKKNYL